MFAKTLHVDTFSTKDGAALTDEIHQAQEALGLNEVLGCAPRTFYMDAAINEPHSIFGLYISALLYWRIASLRLPRAR